MMCLTISSPKASRSQSLRTDTSGNLSVYLHADTSPQNAADEGDIHFSYVDVIAGKVGGNPVFAVIPDGASSVTLNLIADWDGDYFEGEQTYYLGILDDPAYDSDPENFAEITIQNFVPTVSVSAGANALESGPTNGSFTFTREPSDGNILLFLAYSGSATLGTDYSAASSVTLPGGQSPASVTEHSVVPVNDNIHEPGGETVVVNVTNGAIFGNPGPATITIIDNDDHPTVSGPGAGVSDWTGSEGTAAQPATASFSVTISHPSNQTISVSYSTQNDTAISSEDYETRSGTLQIPPGQTGGSFTVPITHDTKDEDNERFFVNVSTGSGSDQGEGIIQDNDNVPSVSINNISVSEARGTSHIHGHPFRSQRQDRFCLVRHRRWAGDCWQ